MQWGFCKYVLSKKVKADIFNKSAFANRKLIDIITINFVLVNADLVPKRVTYTSNLELKH